MTDTDIKVSYSLELGSYMNSAHHTSLHQVSSLHYGTQIILLYSVSVENQKKVLWYQCLSESVKGYRNVVCIYVVLILVISIIRRKRSCVLEEAELLICILDKLIAGTGIASNQFRWRWRMAMVV